MERQGQTIERQKQRQKEDKEMGVLKMWAKRTIQEQCPKRQGENEPMEIVVTVLEARIVESTKNDWWIDSGATQHVCKSRSCFVKIDDV